MKILLKLNKTFLKIDISIVMWKKIFPFIWKLEKSSLSTFHIREVDVYIQFLRDNLVLCLVRRKKVKNKNYYTTGWCRQKLNFRFVWFYFSIIILCKKMIHGFSVFFLIKNEKCFKNLKQKNWNLIYKIFKSWTYSWRKKNLRTEFRHVFKNKVTFFSFLLF